MPAEVVSLQGDCWQGRKRFEDRLVILAMLFLVARLHGGGHWQRQHSQPGLAVRLQLAGFAPVEGEGQLQLAQ